MSSKALIALVVVTALTTAAVIPLDRPGLGWLLAGLAVAALMVGLHRGRAATPAAVVVILLGMGMIRAAGWVFALCAVAAVLVAGMAVVNGQTWRAMVLAIPRWVRAGLLGLGWAGREIAPTDRLGAVRLARSVAIAGVLTVGFGLLLGSADQAFSQLLRDWTPNPSPGRVVGFIASFATLTVLGLGALLLRGISPADPPRARPPWNRVDWMIPVTGLNVLFTLFVLVQFRVLSGGHEYVLDPDGPTYAQHARGGFVQLGIVSVLTLAVVAVVLSRLGDRDKTYGRLLIGLLCGLTLVIVGSALLRMNVYVEAFGYTRLRLVSTALIVWLALIFALILVLGRSRLLPRLVLGAGVLVLMGLVAVNPDRVIAHTVIGRYEKDGHLDAPYLAGLSADALTALDKIPEPKRSCIASRIVAGVPAAEPWYALNSPRAAARKIELEEWEDCDFYLSGGYRLEGNWIDPSDLTGG